jgi:hypothetical protein
MTAALRAKPPIIYLAALFYRLRNSAPLVMTTFSFFHAVNALTGAPE